MQYMASRWDAGDIAYEEVGWRVRFSASLRFSAYLTTPSTCDI